MKEIPLTLDVIKSEVGRFYEQELGGDLLFVIIYGSWAFGVNKKNSDVDMVGVCSRHTPGQLERTISFVKDIHLKYGLALDEEVPYHRKILVTEKFAGDAINGKGFVKRGKIIIPPVVKTKHFLSSDKMAMRLFLNAITTQNVFCSGDYGYYQLLRETALRNCVRIFYSSWEADALSISDFVGNLINWQNRSGQEYIGFEDNPLIRGYLEEQFTSQFNLLEKEKFIVRKDGIYARGDLQWFKEIAQR